MNIPKNKYKKMCANKIELKRAGYFYNTIIK